VLRSVDFILVKDFANSIDILLVWQSFLFWNHFSYFKDYVYSKSSLLKWKQRCPFLKRPFANQAFWSKTQHTFFQNIQSFDCHVFWKQKLTRCKTKMAFFFFFFFFFSWFFVSILDSDFGYIFWGSVMRWPFLWIKKKQDVKVKTQALSRKVVSLLHTYFISMHNNQ
jgi:hypothetical protein